MKSIEEKAKRYDEAIEKAKEFKNNPFAGYDGTDLISALFPELTESEDERIRKALRERIIRYDPNNEILIKEEGISQRQFIAWIEKQGKIVDYYEDRVDECACKYFNKGYKQALKTQGEQKHVDTDNKFIRMRETKPKDISEFLDRLTTVEQEFLWEHIAKIRELDKEEQKLADNVEPKFRVGDTIIAKLETCMEHEPFHITNISDGFYWSGENSILVDNQNEFELYKVEPKFKVGDWVVYDGWTCQITDVKEDGYCNDHNGFIPKDREDDMRLWTIQDAKEGDVLTCYSDIKGQPIEQTGIIKQYVGRHGGCSNSFKAYFGVDWDNNVVIEGYMGSSNIYPATKEQRDTLMKAMADAGYTFDFEKKELRKIEYIRTDAFIKKACEFIETYPHMFMGVLRSEVIEDFKNYIKK